MRWVSFIILPLFLAAASSAQQHHKLKDAAVTTQRIANLIAPEGIEAGYLNRFGGAVPDTTSPWRYYPLHVGNRWEHERDDGVVRRRIIEKDTVIANQDYVMWKEDIITDGTVTVSTRLPLRYDTLTATVIFRAGNGQELVFYLAPCRFDSDFNVTITCSPGLDFFVTGTTSGTIEFEPDTTVEGVTIKTFQSEFYSVSFGAGFGEVEEVCFEGGGTTRLTYARIDGTEYGIAQYPVTIEPPVDPGDVPLGRLSIWPNPTTDVVFVELKDVRFTPQVIRIFDMRGRRLRQVYSEDLARSSIFSLDVSDLPRGTYQVVVTDSQAGLSQATLMTKH